MKSKLLSLIAATVTLIGLAGALSCPVYAAEAPKLSAFCDVDGSVTVNCTKDSTDYVFAAFYDSNGCLLDCVVAADQDSITPPKDAASFKAFLLNEEAAPQLPAAELPVSAGFCTVYTETELQNVMNSEDFCGAILGNDFTLTEITIPAGKTLDVPEGTTLTVSGTLHVYGALVNNGKIGNFGFIDVLGGSLINGGTIEGSWNEADECFASSLGIEGGAYIENSGEIHDSVAVADYYREAGEAICEINGDLEITDGYIAVAFGAEPIQSCLTSDKGYDFVMACGTDPNGPNVIELGGITVPAGKSLLLKGSVFDGEHTYENTYRIGEDTLLTLERDSMVLCMEGAEIQNFGTVNVYGALVNNGKIGNFGFIDVLGGSLINGGTIEGSWNEAGESYDSSLGIEGGAYVENSGEIHDSVAVADYYREAGEAICEINGDLEITDGYIAVAFGAEPIQSCLTSDKGYDFVMACGTDPNGPNVIELGGITVPEGKSLLLKGSVFDGEHTYENTYQIAEGTALTLSENAALVCVGNGRIVIHGSLDNQGGYVGFGEFEVTGTGDFGNE